jgi:hypothetical protein
MRKKKRIWKNTRMKKQKEEDNEQRVDVTNFDSYFVNDLDNSVKLLCRKRRRRQGTSSRQKK